jgi:hypothetical protein
MEHIMFAQVDLKAHNVKQVKLQRTYGDGYSILKVVVFDTNGTEVLGLDLFSSPNKEPPVEWKDAIDYRREKSLAYRD